MYNMSMSIYMSYLFQILFFFGFFYGHSMPPGVQHVAKLVKLRRQGDEDEDLVELVTFNAAISACAKVAVTIVVLDDVELILG